jgi:hypothetical protein
MKIRLFLPLLALVPAIVAAQFQFHPEIEGRWKATSDYSAARKYALGAAEQQEFARKLDALAAVLRSAPAFQPPRGFDASLFTSLRADCAAPCAAHPVEADLALVFLCYLPNSKGQLTAEDGRAAANLRINDPYATIPADRRQGATYSLGLKDSAGREMAYEPMRTGSLGGIPVYDNARLIFAKGARPYWRPVSRESYLGALIAREEAQLGQMEKEARESWRRWQAEAAERNRSRAELHSVFKKTDPAQAETYLRESAKSEAQMEANLKEALRMATDPDAPTRAALKAYRAELAGLTAAELASDAWVMPGT